jgi:hypothetical protein
MLSQVPTIYLANYVSTAQSREVVIDNIICQAKKLQVMIRG